MCRRLFSSLFAAWIFPLVLLPLTVRSEGLRLQSVGTRAAMSQRELNNNYYQAEAFANWDVPWRWGKENKLHFQPRLGLSTGWLHGWDEDGFVGSAGPGVAMGWNRIPVFLELGIGVTGLSRYQFGPQNFGSKLQFTSYLGFTLQPGSRLSFGYRYQHMSNGGLDSPNPGLNLHSMSLGWRF